jgi:hypothetical protein
MKGHRVKFLSHYFGYTRDGYYKSLEHVSSSEQNREILISSVLEIRRAHPRMGGKKMYHLLGGLALRLHVGRDRFFKILEESDLLVNRKKSGAKTTNSYHRFHVYKK